MWELIFYSLLGGVFSLLGGLLVLWKSKLANKLMLPLISFGAGAFMGAALLDIMPEAIEMASEPHEVMLAVTIGFTGFFMLERLLMKYMKKPHSHEETSAHTEALPVLLISGDSLHNFLDGIVIAIAYLANPALGFTTAIAIAAHELPQEIGDFSILLKMGWKKNKIIAVNVMQSLITIPGVFLGYYLGQTIEVFLPSLLGITSGVFLYLGASNLIPEIHHQAGHKNFGRVILPFVTSLIFIYLVGSWLHQ